MPAHVQFWKSTFTLSTEISDLLENGYTPPFVSWPLESELPNNYSTRAPGAQDFIDNELIRLERSAAISPTAVRPHCVLPLQLVHRPGKSPRLVIDASRQINPRLQYRRVRLTTLKEINSGVAEGNWWASMDLKSGYYHVAIHPNFRKYFGIKWTFQTGVVKYYVWNVCFLGISDLVRTFTKLMRPIMSYFHGRGIRADIYIDDIRCTAATKNECQNQISFIRRTLDKAGFVESIEKAVPPTQYDVFLGLVNDTRHLRYFIPDSKLCDIELTIDRLLARQRARVKEVASLYGKLASCRLATGPIIRLLTRDGQRTISDTVASAGWDSWLTVQLCKKELRFLRAKLRSFNGFPFTGKELVMSVDGTIASDASNKGLSVIKLCCGASINHVNHSSSCESDLLIHRRFSEFEVSMSSTARELIAIHDAYLSPALTSRFSGQRIAHLTDNKGAASIFKVGSPVPALQKMALEVFKSCREHNISLQVHWRPRNDPRLQQADARSREFDNDDWSIDYDGFCRIEQFSTRDFQIDLFATKSNAKCVRFVSKFKSERHEAVGINAFTLNWRRKGYFYACPPPRLIVPTLLQVATQKASGILICPRWTSAHFWPYLLPDGSHFCKLVSRFKFFRPTCLIGPHILSSTFKGVLTFDLIMLELEGNIAAPFKPHVYKSHCVTTDCKMCK